MALGAYSAVTWFLPSSTWQAKAAFGAALAVNAAGVFLVQAHDRGALCEKCGELPEDVETRARRRCPLLAWEHITHDTRRRHRVTEAILWALVTVSALAPTAWAAAVTTPIFAWVLASLWATRVHNRLAPWCPWCRRGGDDEAAESPTPSMYRPA